MTFLTVPDALYEQRESKEAAQQGRSLRQLSLLQPLASVVVDAPM